MTRTASSTRMIALVASTALASLALGACTTSAAPRADLSASKAQQALTKGRGDQAVGHAEAAVLAEPQIFVMERGPSAVRIDLERQGKPLLLPPGKHPLREFREMDRTVD